MKMMLVCENDADKKEVARIFEQMTNELAQFNDIEANYWEGGVCTHDKGSTDIYPTGNPIVYAYQADGTYTGYNFQTKKKTEGVEGDLAGLANLPEEDFPTL